MIPRRHIPNALTVLRVVLTIVFIMLLAWPGHTPWPFARDIELLWAVQFTFEHQPWLPAAALLFIVAAATDALDGYLARKWKVVSKFGRVMDPFADKLLVLGAFVMLAGPNFTYRFDGGQHLLMSRVEPWMVVVILGRELLVTSLRGVLEAGGVDFSATLSGKLKMILQSIAVPLILLTLCVYTPWPGSTTKLLLDVVVWSTVLVSALSGVPYVLRAIALSSKPPAQSA